MLELQKIFLIVRFFNFPREDKILGWCPAGPALPHMEKVPLLASVCHPSSDIVTIKMPYEVDVLHRPASQPLFSYWVG